MPANKAKRTYTYGPYLCEHCDGVHQPQRGASARTGRSWLGRLDYLRGSICERCDDALDEMFAE
jgi:hypothetical protein